AGQGRVTTTDWGLLRRPMVELPKLRLVFEAVGGPLVNAKAVPATETTSAAVVIATFPLSPIT
ncbi:MAG: hypothetical protein QOD60_1865, partial [Solirubrobacterales bacterium]|nr:hypothetical protein [Solirubrobacterales bacterium]